MTQSSVIDPQWLENTYASLERAKLDPQAVVVVQSGQPVASAVWEPFRLDEPGLVHSVSKTFTAAAVGLAESEDLLDLHAPAWTYLLDQEPRGERARRITLHHLLSMNSGHSGEQIDKFGPPYNLNALFDTEPEHEPGSYFCYNSCASFLLSAAVQRVTGQRLTDYLRPRIFDPLGIADRYWLPNGDYDQGYSGLHITAGEIAALAGLYLGWSAPTGSNPLPAGWGELSARAHSDNSNHDSQPDNIVGYGYQVWRSQYGFRLDGAYGQWGLIIPELDLVIGYRGGTQRTAQVLQIWWDELVTKMLAAGAGTYPAEPTDRSATVQVPATELNQPAPLHSSRALLSHFELPAGADDPGSPAAEHITPAPHLLHVLADGSAEIELGEHRLPVGDAWTRHTVEVGADRTLQLAGAGEFLPDGGWSGSLFVTTSCHRLALRSSQADAGQPGTYPLELEWGTVPLWKPTLAELALPITSGAGN